VLAAVPPRICEDNFGHVHLGNVRDRLIIEAFDMAPQITRMPFRKVPTKENSTTPSGKLMLTVLGGLAEFERELIKIRTSEGRERAKRAGVKMGRKPILSAHQIAEIRTRKANGEYPGALAQSEREILLPSLFSVLRTLGSLMLGLGPSGRGHYGLRSGLSPVARRLPRSSKTKAA